MADFLFLKEAVQQLGLARDVKNFVGNVSDRLIYHNHPVEPPIEGEACGSVQMPLLCI